MYIHTIDHIGLIHTVDKRILLIKPVNGKEWSLPGGKIEEGETYLAALGRILREQISPGVDPDSIKFFKSFVGQSYGTSGGIKIKMTCYMADFNSIPKAVDKKNTQISYLSYKDKSKVGMISRMVFDDLRDQGIIS